MLAEFHHGGCRQVVNSTDYCGWRANRTNYAPFWRMSRQKSADIYDKFRRGSQLQNYILSLHNFSSFSSIQRRLFDYYSLTMHFC
ncbi:hypothetical protein B8043_25780 [Klebsiella aerogenes]|nr:hypothetical protein AM407_15215 [Klebsiella aerogenes]OVK31507.1 hypothetical protein B8043_25780 [Klebsiella aerogenes]